MICNHNPGEIVQKRNYGHFTMKRIPIHLVLVLLGGTALANDWPQWQGPDRTAVSKETGLLKEWPKDGPPLAWKVKNLGGGYSAPSVAAGRIFGMCNRGNDEVVWALDEADGKELWATRLGAAVQAQRMPQAKEGPGCTPTVDGDFAYALGMGGDLVCLQVDGRQDRLAQEPHRRLRRDRAGVELPRIAADRRRQADLSRPAARTPRSSPSTRRPARSSGRPRCRGATRRLTPRRSPSTSAGSGSTSSSSAAASSASRPTDGKFLWRYDQPANGIGINVTTPLYHDGLVFATSAYGAGGGLAKLSKDDKGGVKAEEVYFTRKMQNHHGGVILLDGYLYGASGGNEGGYLICLDFKTGKVMWDERDKPGRKGVKKGSVACADGRLYYRQEDGTMILFEPSPKEYIERGRFEQPDRSSQPAWPHPVIANGKLYLRDQDVLLCYDVKAK